jgi:peptidoglycan/xylan/chitin deacetylase (PgdA/CDA1 family)
MKAMVFAVVASWALTVGQGSPPRREPACTPTSILVYHRFATNVADSMTVRVTTFRTQLGYLQQHHYPVITLRALVDCLNNGAAVPARAVVITADDGHTSVFTDMLPLAREFDVPVTLFVYPSAISNASYALTWEQLSALRRTGRFDIQSHTYWHPNFKIERRRLGPEAYRAFATVQLARARTVIRDRVGAEPDLVAWPFGIYDDQLIAIARDVGYKAGFTLGRRVVTSPDAIMALPRFLVTDDAVGGRFAAMLSRQVP